MEMDVGLLDHYNILTRKLDETVRFYERQLGMRSRPRPPFDVPGARLYRGDHPVVHVIDIAGTAMEQGAGAGAVDHRLSELRLCGDETAFGRTARAFLRQPRPQKHPVPDLCLRPQ